MKIEKTKLCAVILKAPGKKGLRESEPSKLKFILLSRGYPGNAAIRKLTQIAGSQPDGEGHCSRGSVSVLGWPQRLLKKGLVMKSLFTSSKTKLE